MLHETRKTAFENSDPESGFQTGPKMFHMIWSISDRPMSNESFPKKYRVNLTYAKMFFKSWN